MEISSREVAELVKKVLANMNGDVAKAGANVLIYSILSPQLEKVYKKLFKM